MSQPPVADSRLTGHCNCQRASDVSDIDTGIPEPAVETGGSPGGVPAAAGIALPASFPFSIGHRFSWSVIVPATSGVHCANTAARNRMETAIASIERFFAR